MRILRYNFFGPDVSSGKKISSKKFTGVYNIYTTTLFKGSDIYVTLGGFQVKQGNFAFYIIFDGEVVGQIQPDEYGFGEFTLKNASKIGALEYVIAGESANFEFIAPIEVDDEI